MAVTVSSAFLTNLLSSAPEVARQALTRHADSTLEVDFRTLRPSRDRIPVRLVSECWRIAEHFAGEHVALATAAATPPGSFGAAEHLATMQANLGESLASFCRSTALLHDLTHCELRRAGNQVSFVQMVKWESKDLAHYGTTHLFSMILRTMSRLARSPIKLRSVTFSAPSPHDVAPLEAVFGTNLAFDAQVDAMEFATDPYRLDVLPTDGSLREVLEDYVALRLATDQPSCLWEGRTQARIAERIKREERVTLEAVATELGVSARKLQQALAKERTTFESIHDALREALGARWLRLGEPAQDVALRLGYQDVASFSRAFKRWTGKRPSAFQSR